MLPVALDLSRMKVALVGRGTVVRKRLDALIAAGASALTAYVVEPDDGVRALVGVILVERLPSPGDLDGVKLLFAAGLDPAEAEAVAAQAQAAGALVNVEDVVPLCDVHLPATVRRGELTISVSTGGKSPALARRLRRYLEEAFGEAWTDRLEHLATARLSWRKAGKPPSEILQLSDEMIDGNQWLPPLPRS